MVKLNVSAVHSLQLIPVDRMSKFAVLQNHAFIVLTDLQDSAGEIPGSVKIQTSDDDGKIKKTITYKRRPVDLPTANLLESYRHRRLIAVYVDETGSRRVAGSPDYPLTFSFTSGDGVFSCKLEGETTGIDPFLG